MILEVSENLPLSKSTITCTSYLDFIDNIEAGEIFSGLFLPFMHKTYRS
jgi:hypothetical protein